MHARTNSDTPSTPTMQNPSSHPRISTSDDSNASSQISSTYSGSGSSHYYSSNASSTTTTSYTHHHAHSHSLPTHTPTSPPLIVVSSDSLPIAPRPLLVPRKRYYAQNHSSQAAEKEGGDESGKREGGEHRDVGEVDLSERRRSLGAKERVRRFSLKIVGLGW